MSYLIFVLILAVLCAIAVFVGAFLGSSNPRCYSEFSNQGRTRLDDCDQVECQSKGRCKFKPSLKESSRAR